jgi:plasmid maintenance system antidote protein VapI
MIFELAHPGRILKRELEARGLSAAALALMLRIAP